MLKTCVFGSIKNFICINSVSSLPKRSFTRLLSAISNKPDEERIKLLGPDRSCAEWLLRNGASIKWAGSAKWTVDYNSLPGSDNKGNYFIEEIDVDEAGIMQVGFRHFEGCNHIKKLRLHHCPYLTEEAFEEVINKLKHSLEHLVLTSCGDISDSGLAHISKLSLLKTLFLRDLPEVRDPQKSYNLLKASIPECQIKFPDLDRAKK